MGAVLQLIPAPAEKPSLPAPGDKNHGSSVLADNTTIRVSPGGNAIIVGNKPHATIIDGISVVDRNTGHVHTGSVDLGATLERIDRGVTYPHRNDGSIFQNRSGSLPPQPSGYYKEYVVPTPGVSGPGPQRVVIGAGGEKYYTPDHYSTFIRINP